MSGLAVVQLALDAAGYDSDQILGRYFDSPLGLTTIWDINAIRRDNDPGVDPYYFPAQLRTWVASLAQPHAVS